MLALVKWCLSAYALLYSSPWCLCPCGCCCSFFIDRQCNDALWMSPAGFGSCCTLVSSHCQGMSISCPSAWPLSSPVTDCSLRVDLPLHGHVHLCDCLSGVSFSFQVWRSPWDWWRDLEALARGELLPLWEGTVVMPRGSMRSTATMLNSVTVSPWTEAFPTTDLKSMSTSCFFAFSDMYIVLLTTPVEMYTLLAGLCSIGETCQWEVFQFNPCSSWWVVFKWRPTMNGRTFCHETGNLIKYIVFFLFIFLNKFSFLLASWWISRRFAVPKQNQSCNMWCWGFLESTKTSCKHRSGQKWISHCCFFKALKSELSLLYSSPSLLGFLFPLWEVCGNLIFISKQLQQWCKWLQSNKELLLGTCTDVRDRLVDGSHKIVEI